MTNNFISYILDIIYPQKCAICGKVDRIGICKNCLKTLEKEEICQIIKYDIKQCKWNFEEHIYFFEYKEKIREKIIEYKFEDKPYLYKTFANILLNNEKLCAILDSYDIIAPVPMYYKKEIQRGYNQAELIVNEFSDKIQKLNLLVKIKNTAQQSKLKRIDRLTNLENAYIVNDKYIEYIKNKKILIFDDIFTTGSTTNECARELRKYEPKKIGVLTIAKDFIEK